MAERHAYRGYPNPSKPSCVICGLPQDDPIHLTLEHKVWVPKSHSEPIFMSTNEGAVEPRIGRHEMFLEIAHVLRKRSTCNRGKVGCVIVQDRRIVSTGYNGSPAGSPHCLDIGCEPHTNEHVEGCMRTVHAEANAIVFAAKHGVAVGGSTMYSTHSPCHGCAKLIVSVGIEALYFITDYRDARLDVLEEAGVDWYKKD